MNNKNECTLTSVSSIRGIVLYKIQDCGTGLYTGVQTFIKLTLRVLFLKTCLLLQAIFHKFYRSSAGDGQAQLCSSRQDCSTTTIIQRESTSLRRLYNYIYHPGWILSQDTGVPGRAGRGPLVPLRWQKQLHIGTQSISRNNFSSKWYNSYQAVCKLESDYNLTTVAPPRDPVVKCWRMYYTTQAFSSVFWLNT